MSSNSISPNVPSNPRRRNLFDLSQKEVHSLTAGVITPTRAYEVITNDEVRARSDYFMRARTLETAAFARLEVHHDAYFVPFRILWNSWNTFISGMPYNEIESSRFFEAPSYGKNNVAGQTELMPECPRLALFSFLRSFCHPAQLPSWNTDPSKITNDFGKNTPEDYPLETICPYTDSSGLNVLGNMLKLLDMLGYGNYRSLYFGLLNGQLVRTQAPEDGQLTVTIGDKYVNPFRLMAYYCIINNYYRNEEYEYRSNFWNLDFNTADTYESYQIYNWWQLFGEESNPLLTDDSKAGYYFSFFGMGTPLYRRDYLTDIYPNALYNRTAQTIFQTIGAPPTRVHLNPVNNGSQQALSGSSVFGKASSLPNPNTVYAQGYGNGISGSFSGSDWVSNPGAQDGNGSLSNSTTAAAAQSVSVVNVTTSVAAMRNAEALEKLLTITRFASKSFVGQMRAHRNVSLSYGDFSPVPTRLGSSAFAIDINEVVASATTGSVTSSNASQLGEIGGKGVGSGQLVYNSQFKEFGTVIELEYITCPPETTSFLDPHNTKFELEDFYQPESDNLGMQPLYVETTPFSANALQPYVDEGLTVYGRSGFDDMVVGWQPRYIEYKSACDVNHFSYGDFSNALSSYVVQRNPSAFLAYRVHGAPNISGGGAPSGTYLPLLHVLPINFESLFLVKPTGNVSTDNFDCNEYHEVKMFRDMSVSGMPSYN